eukprot:scaffold1822_cov333-Pavlova_lutheri.AAC.20
MQDASVRILHRECFLVRLCSRRRTSSMVCPGSLLPTVEDVLRGLPCPPFDRPGVRMCRGPQGAPAGGIPVQPTST